MSNNTNTNVGSDNSVLGSWALSSATNDTSCNSAFGSNSLLKHTKGSFNTSLGAGAMTFNITGNRNVAVGSSALEFNTNSENNTAIGTQALFGPCDGSNNTAIGFLAGANDASGSYNTYLGANTGTTLSQSLISYTNSTAIGYGATIDKSNRIVLGRAGQEVYIPGYLTLSNPSNTNISTGGGGGGGGGSLTLNPQTIDYLVGEFDILTNPMFVVYPKFNISLFSEFDFKITQRGLDTARLENNIPDDITEAELKQLLVNSLYLYENIDNFDTNNKSGYDVNYGVCNVAIGPKSLSNVTSTGKENGWFNTAVGSFSQMSNTKGSYNTTIGSHSLLKNKDGFGNVGIGSLAGWNDISGNNNTYLGGRTETTIPSQGFFSNSTAIGYRAKITDSSQIVLGRSTEFVCIPSNRGLSIGKTTAPETGIALDVNGSIVVSRDMNVTGTYNADISNNIKIGSVRHKSIRSVFRPAVIATDPETSVKINITDPNADTSIMTIENTSTSPLVYNELFITSSTGLNPLGYPNTGIISWSENNTDSNNSLGVFVVSSDRIMTIGSSSNILLLKCDSTSDKTTTIESLKSIPLAGEFPFYKSSSDVQIIKLYMGLYKNNLPFTPASDPDEYIYLDDYIKLQLVSTITISPTTNTIPQPPPSIIPNNSTYLGANIKYLSDVDTSTSTAIGYGANIDINNQIVLGTSGEFVCVPSNRGLSIGKTTAPSYNLDVSGSINFTGEIYKNGVVFVSSSGSNNSVNDNLFVAKDISGNGNLFVAKDISGNSNLFVAKDISGNGNLFVAKDISGNSNLFVAKDISGNGNLYISGQMKINQGVFAYDYNGYNVSLFSIIPKPSESGYLGYQVKTGHNSTSGDPLTSKNFGNTAIGAASLNGNTTGSGNTAIGARSLFYNTSGYYNTSIGGDSLFVNETGNHNVSIGIGSLYKHISGDYNTSIGDNAGNSDISGNKNTFIGSYADISSNYVIQNSTAIGYNAKIDASNQIVLGTSGEFVCIPSNRGLSIGKATAPTSNYALDISGSINFTGEIYKNDVLFVSSSGSSNSINSGLFVFGDISGNGKLDVTGDISGNSGLFLRGSVEAASYNATSDYRIKDNVRNLDEQDNISNLRPVKYFNNQTNKNDYGLIAHELQTEYPDLVSGEKDGQELQSVNYIGLISVLIKEVQELKCITAEQAIEIAELKSTFLKG